MILWNSTLELFELVYRLRGFKREWRKNPKYNDFLPLFTAQDEWTVVKYVMEVLRAFQYWTQWMSKQHSVTLPHVITLYNDMFDHMDGVISALAKKKTPWKEDLRFVVKCARQKLSKYYTEVTPMTGMFVISAHILDPFRMLRSFRKWDKGIDINPQNETSYTTQYQEAFLKYVENQYCAKHRCLMVIMSENTMNNNLSSFAMASGSDQSTYDLYDLSSDDNDYLIPTNVAETTPGQTDHAVHLMTVARLFLNSPPELQQNRGQIDPNLNDYHSDPMKISSTFWFPDITDRWRQQEETHSKYADLYNVTHIIFSTIPRGVTVEASFPLGER
jgi:hypothetical protein